MERLRFIFPAQMVAVCELEAICVHVEGALKILEWQSFRSGKVYCSCRIPISEPEIALGKDSTFNILILKLGKKEVVAQRLGEGEGEVDDAHLDAHHGGGGGEGGSGEQGEGGRSGLGGDGDGGSSSKGETSTGKRKRASLGGKKVPQGEDHTRKEHRSDQGWTLLLRAGLVKPGDRIRHSSSKAKTKARFGLVVGGVDLVVAEIQEDEEDGSTSSWKNPVAFACKINDWHVDDESYRRHRSKIKSCVRIRADSDSKEETKLDDLLKQLKPAAAPQETEVGSRSPAGAPQETGSRQESPEY